MSTVKRLSPTRLWLLLGDGWCQSHVGAVDVDDFGTSDESVE